MHLTGALVLAMAACALTFLWLTPWPWLALPYVVLLPLLIMHYARLSDSLENEADNG
jgi:1,4-dihydroxy-2-naphthoate octaprenyltransferase